MMIMVGGGGVEYVVILLLAVDTGGWVVVRLRAHAEQAACLLGSMACLAGGCQASRLPACLS